MPLGGEEANRGMLGEQGSLSQPRPRLFLHLCP